MAHNHAEAETILFIWGNKTDWNSKREVSTEEALKISEKHNAWFIETSAKDNTNVEELFTLWVINYFNVCGIDSYSD